MIIHAQVVGIKVANPKSEKRNELLANCKKGELLSLKRERDNLHDSYAVAVMRITGEKLGYLSQDAAKTIADEMDNKNAQFEAILAKIGPKGGGLFSLL